MENLTVNNVSNVDKVSSMKFKLRQAVEFVVEKATQNGGKGE